MTWTRSRPTLTQKTLENQESNSNIDATGQSVARVSGEGHPEFYLYRAKSYILIHNLKRTSDFNRTEEGTSVSEVQHLPGTT